jgi:DNA polymerase-3 subunit delta'
MADYFDQNKLLEIVGVISRSSHPQALIFAGMKGIGKASAAKELANYLLPSHNDLLHNLLWLEPEGVITIEQIRQIKDFFSHTICNDSYRIVVIDNADELNSSSANALLKILEEPPNKSLLILISHKPYNLIDTIKSRCALIKFRSPGTAHEVVSKNLTLESREIDTLLRMAHNVPGIAISLGINQGLVLYKDIISALNNYSSNYDETYKVIVNYFTDNSHEKWWLFSYLINYLLEKVIKASCLGRNENNLFDEEKILIDMLVSKKSIKDWMLIYDEVTQLMDNTKKLYLDYKNAAITIMQLIIKVN